MTGPWGEPGYGDIASVEQFGDQIEVAFLNGDVVLLSPRRFGIHGDFEVALAEEDEGLAITLAGPEFERAITWSQLRAATDPEFAQEMRRQDAEESSRLGRRLRALREDHGLNQKDLAALVGMSGPQLSKIENGTSDLRFSTVQTLLRAMGATLDDIAGPGALELSQKGIRRQAAAHGVNTELMERLFENAPRRSIPALLQRAFSWSVGDLASGAVTPPQRTGAVFKTTQQQDTTISPLVPLARRVAEIVHHHAELAPSRGVPSDAAAVRTQLGGGAIHLKSLLAWTWDRGIAVVPLHGRGGFYAASWMFDGSPAVVLKDTRPLAAFWLFDLAHELGHIALNHLDSGGIVDVDELRLAGDSAAGEDEQEHDANAFALRLLLGNYRALLGEVRTESRGNYLRFKGAVATVARKRHVNPGLLGMVAAHELSDIGEPKDRWGSATNLARAEGDGREIVTQMLTSRVDLSRLSEIDTMLIKAAVDC
jgi:transcriptional regulator with XRE-family HTH domain